MGDANLKCTLWTFKQQDSIPVGCVPPTCQPYVFHWLPLYVTTGWELGPQVNKYEQVSSDDHQMSVTGVSLV